jgi:uncharacterized lipoprotein YbaY
VITGTLSYDETHELTDDAKAVVFLVDVTVGPNAGTVVGSVAVKDPGAQPIPFQLSYPLSAVSASNEYELFAGIVDGDSAWATPTGTSVPIPRQEIGGVQLELDYRPDLLKGAVTGSIAGEGLGPITDPDAYGTSILVDTSTGQTIGFQMIEPITADPIPFSAPYNPSAIDKNATYVARGSVWTGTTLWNTPTGVAVITNGNPKSGVVLTVVESSVTTTPASGTPAWLPWLLLLAAVGAVVVVALYLRNRRVTVTEGTDGPGTPPPPPGPDAPPPPPGDGPDTPPPPPSDPGDAVGTDDVPAAADVPGAAQPIESPTERVPALDPRTDDAAPADGARMDAPSPPADEADPRR